MSSKRVSHRDPEERDNEEELDHESSTASTAQKLSQGTKAVLDKSWSLIWGNITAPVNDAHTVNEAPDKSLDVHRLGLRMHHSTSGLPATSGKVTFTQDLEQQKQQQPTSFACMSSDTDPGEVIKLFGESYWSLKPPSVIISVTGSAADFALDSGVEQLVTQGIARAARATSAWTFTGGTDTGVMKLVAGALAKAKVVTPIIGVAPFHKITDKKRFFDAEHDRGSGTRHWLRVHYFKRTDNTDASHALDTQHTHFLLVDDGIGSDWGSEIEFRGKVEEKISEHLRVPRVQLVIQGGLNTLKTVADTLGTDHRRSCHVVIVKESGGCARAIAEFVEPLLQEAELFLNPELLKRRVLLPAVQLNIIVSSLRSIGNKLQLLHVFTITDVHRTSFDMAILKAIVSSFKMREDCEAEAEQKMLRTKALRSLLPTDVPPHDNARRHRGGNPEYLGKWIAVSDKQVPWIFAWPDYNPNEFTAPVVIENSALLSTGQKWADPAELHGPAVKDGFGNLLAEVRERTTYLGGFDHLGGPRGVKLATAIRFDAAGVPLNPRGRTGLRGRGLLGKWGPNHAADPIVTRWNPEKPKQLQMVAIKRKDTGDWAIPGGMVDEGEKVSVTLKREFTEEAGSHLDQRSKARFDELVAQLFTKGELVYCGCE